MEPIFRPIAVHEYNETLDHWSFVFNVPRAYFENYYESDPWNQEGDTVGAFVDGKLVSAVHVCRRPLTWNGRTLLCGGVANVATHPEYRSRSLSGKLLQMAIVHMEAEKFDFSVLGTGLHSHYARFGWETVIMPRYTVTPPAGGRALDAGLAATPATPGPEQAAIYEHNSRPMKLSRPSHYFNNWLRWFWKGDTTKCLTIPGQGYIVAGFPEDTDKPASIKEWQVVNEAAEAEILAEAVAWAQSMGRSRVHFEGTPQFGGLAALEQLGAVEAEPDKYHMWRNVGLSDEDFVEVTRLYASGEANWWHSDGF